MYRLLESYRTRTSVRSVAGWPLTGSCCVKLSIIGAVAPRFVGQEPVDLDALPGAHRLNLVLLTRADVGLRIRSAGGCSCE